MKKIATTIILSVSAILLVACNSVDLTNSEAKKTKHRLVAVQMWSLHTLTFEEAVNSLKDLGFDGIECYPGQALTKTMSNATISANMTAQQIAFAKKNRG